MLLGPGVKQGASVVGVDTSDPALVLGRRQKLRTARPYLLVHTQTKTEEQFRKRAEKKPQHWKLLNPLLSNTDKVRLQFTIKIVLLLLCNYYRLILPVARTATTSVTRSRRSI